MAQLGQTFDANGVAPATPMELIPPGDYTVEIVNSEMRDTKDGAGKYLWLEMDIVDGPCAKRKLWDRLNLVNGNSQAQEIAQRALSAICHAVGQMQVNDSEQLHHRPLKATVKVRPARGEYGASNEIRGYQPASGAPRPQQAQTGAPAAAKSAAPWKRNAA
jgi:hypothetical protein